MFAVTMELSPTLGPKLTIGFRLTNTVLWQPRIRIFQSLQDYKLFKSWFCQENTIQTTRKGFCIQSIMKNVLMQQAQSRGVRAANAEMGNVEIPAVVKIDEAQVPQWVLLQW